MTHSPFDSDIFGDLFGDPVIGALMSDDALIRSMMKVEGHLAQVQGTVFRCLSLYGFSVKRWRQVPMRNTCTGGPRLKIFSTPRFQAHAHKALPMAARTRNQMATPTSFGARVAIWGSPFLRHLERLEQARARLQVVSFAGASGTLAALEGRGLEVADALADSLQLGRQQVPWHAARDNIAEIGGVLALLTGSLGKFAEDLISLGQSEVREVSLSAAGGSSTMPHKSNPVAPETILALSKVATAQAGLLETAMLHKGERDGSAWAIEWHALPQLLGAVGGALRHGVELAREMTPNPERMLASIESTKGLMFAEAATFALAQVMSRPDAQKLVKAACGEAVESNADLRVILEPQAALDWDAVFAVEQQMGVAGEFASRFLPFYGRGSAFGLFAGPKCSCAIPKS